jgi:type I restriction enzyme R subunit
MKNPDDDLKLVIVRDMWLTGFDVPCLHTLYIDKPMQGHKPDASHCSRVNRVYKDKRAALIVDYLGLHLILKRHFPSIRLGGKGDLTILQEQAVQLMLEKNWKLFLKCLMNSPPLEGSAEKPGWFSIMKLFRKPKRPQKLS